MWINISVFIHMYTYIQVFTNFMYWGLVLVPHSIPGSIFYDLRSLFREDIV